MELLGILSAMVMYRNPLKIYWFKQYGYLLQFQKGGSFPKRDEEKKKKNTTKDCTPVDYHDCK